MKKFLFHFLMLTTITSVAWGQVPGWGWAKSASGSYDETAYSVAADGQGNVFIAGYFSSSTITFGTTVLTNHGEENIFIAKYNANGDVVWAESFGGTYYDDALSVSADASGNAYLSGYFGSSSVTFGTTTLTSNGSYDIFLVKLDANGNVVWAKSAGGNIEDEAASVAVDHLGNTFITGHFISVPGITFGTTTLTNRGGSDVFVAKYNSSGDVLWAKAAAGDKDDWGTSVVADPSGNCYVAGYFNSAKLGFGNDTLANSNTGLIPTSDVFIAKYNASGYILWGRSAGGSDDDVATGVTRDGNGNIYLTGYFSSMHISFGTTILTNTGGENIFLVKYDANGNVIWAKSAAGGNYDESNSVATDVYGNCYIAGHFTGPNIIFGNDTLTNAGSENMFIAKYDPSGNPVWAKSISGTGTDNAYSVVNNSNGNTFITGYFSSPSVTFGTTTLTNTGSTDIFLAMLNDATGINDYTQLSGYTVFPNPANRMVSLKTNCPAGSEITADFYYSTGQKVKSVVLVPGNNTIRTADLPEGLYIIAIRTKDDIQYRQLIIQR
jgi:hypothetical protein